jgi:hypothetical protein
MTTAAFYPVSNSNHLPFHTPFMFVLLLSWRKRYVSSDDPGSSDRGEGVECRILYKGIYSSLVRNSFCSRTGGAPWRSAMTAFEKSSEHGERATWDREGRATAVLRLHRELRAQSIDVAHQGPLALIIDSVNEGFDKNTEW